MERVILTADEGMIYTNGTDYGKVIYLAIGTDPNNYYQISLDAYNVLMENELMPEEII